MKKLNKILFCVCLVSTLLLPSQPAQCMGDGGINIGDPAPGAMTTTIGVATENEEIKKEGSNMSDSNNRMNTAYTDNTDNTDKIKIGCERDDATECMPYCKYEQKEECLLCPVFAVVFNTVSKLGAVAITTFSSSVIRVVVVGFAIWLAIQILLFASSPETRDLKDLMQSMITQGFLVVVVVAIIQTGVANFFNTFINPVYITGQSMAEAMFNADVCNTGHKGIECREEDKTIVKQTFSSIKKINNGLPQSMGNSIMRTMTMMENRIRKFNTLGSSIMCQSWKEGFLFLPQPIYLITGLLIWAVTMALIFGIPFLMVDSVFQLGVAAALLPIAVGSYAFKITRQYSKKVWETFLNSTFAFLFISITVVIVLGTIQSAVTDGMTEVMKNITGNPTFDGLFTGVNAAQLTYFDEMLKNFAWFSKPFIKMIFIFVLAWTVMHSAKEFAGEFADSISSTSIGSSIGTMAASTAKGMALKAGKPMIAATGHGLGRGVQRLARGARHGARRAWNAGVQAYRFREKKFGLWGKDRGVQIDENGKKSWISDKGAKYTLENGVYSREKAGKIKIKTKNMTLIRTKSLIDGKEVFRDKVKLNNDKLYKALGRDGQINAKEMAAMLDGLKGEERKLMQVALTKAVMEQRFSLSAREFDQSKILKRNKHRILSSETSMNDKTGEITIKEVDTNGEVTFRKMKLNDKGYLETTLTNIDKKGNVKIFSSDGIRTKMEKFKLQDGVEASSLKDTNAVRASRSSKPAKVSYGYTKYWQHQVDHGYNDKAIPPSEMLEGEMKEFYKFTREKGNEFQKSDMKYYFR